MPWLYTGASLPMVSNCLMNARPGKGSYLRVVCVQDGMIMLRGGDGFVCFDLQHVCFAL